MMSRWKIFNSCFAVTEMISSWVRAFCRFWLVSNKSFVRHATCAERLAWDLSFEANDPVSSEAKNISRKVTG